MCLIDRYKAKKPRHRFTNFYNPKSQSIIKLKPNQNDLKTNQPFITTHHPIVPDSIQHLPPAIPLNQHKPAHEIPLRPIKVLSVVIVAQLSIRVTYRVPITVAHPPGNRVTPYPVSGQVAEPSQYRYWCIGHRAAV